MGARTIGKQVEGNRYHPYYLFEDSKGKTRLYKLLDNGEYHETGFSSHSGDKAVKEAQRLRDIHVANQARKENQTKNTPPEATPKDTLKEANDEQIKLTGDRATTEDEFREISNYILARARDEGISPAEILKSIRQNTQLLPEHILKKFSNENGYNLSDALYNRLYNFLARDENLDSLEDVLREKQAMRRDIYEDLADLPNKKEQADESMLDRMISPEMGIKRYQDIWGRLSDDNKEGLTPQGMHSLDTMQGLDALKEQGQKQSDLYSRLMPGKDFSMNWGQNPTYERARDTYNADFKPNYAYSSTAPFDQKEHALAASGHALGSTSLENNDSARQRAVHKEDLENIFNIQKMLETEHRARGDTLKQIEGLGNAGRNSLGEPIKTSEDVLGKQFDRNFDQDYKQNEFKKDVAEGGMSLATAELGEEGSLYNLLKAQNQEAQQEQQQLNNAIYSYLMNVEQLKKGGVVEQKQLEAMEQQLWANKQAVINSIKALAPGIAQMANFGAPGVPNQGWFNSKAN